MIRTEKIASIDDVLKIWDQFTHVIFTSQTTVEYWTGPLDKPTISIGWATHQALIKKGGYGVFVENTTQEGLVDFLKNIDGYFFYPRSKKARDLLKEYLGSRAYVLDLYDTIFQKIEPVVNLDDFDEILFTSPSTVDGFLKIFKTLPLDKKLLSIGPITQKKIEEEIAKLKKKKFG